MMKLKSFTIGLVLTAASASAATVTYSDTFSGANNFAANAMSLWQGASTGVTAVTFDSAAAFFQNGVVLEFDNGTFFNANVSACTSLTSGQACFDRVSSGSHSRNVDSGDLGGSVQYFRGASGNANSYLQIFLAPGITSLGMKLHTSPKGTAVTITAFDSGNVQIDQWAGVPTNTTTTPAFFGLTSDTSIAFIRISTGFSTDDPSISELDFGTASAGGSGGGAGGGAGGGDPTDTPEVATLLSLGTGLLLIGRMSRRRDVQAAA